MRSIRDLKLKTKSDQVTILQGRRTRPGGVSVGRAGATASAASTSSAGGPNPVSNAQRLRRRRAQGFMDTAQIMMRDIEPARRNVIIRLLGETIGQAGKTAAAACDAPRRKLGADTRQLNPKRSHERGRQPRRPSKKETAPVGGKLGPSFPRTRAAKTRPAKYAITRIGLRLSATRQRFPILQCPVVSRTAFQGCINLYPSATRQSHLGHCELEQPVPAPGTGLFRSPVAYFDFRLSALVYRLSGFRRATVRLMKDMQVQLDRLLEQAAECAGIAVKATDEAKRELFTRLADHFSVLASEVERAIAKMAAEE